MIETEQELLDLLAAIADTRDVEIDCDAFLDRVAPLAEQLRQEVALSDAFYAEAHHLRICSGCREEFDALLAVLRGE